MPGNQTPITRPRQTFVLRPHRSLGPRGFLILMALYGGLSFVAGLYFLTLGAWPVFGFLGLDVLLVYVAFRINYGAARETETIEIDADELTVTARNPSGRDVRQAFNPYWLQVNLVELAGGVSELRLLSKGRGVVVGHFLSDPERRELAAALRAAIGGRAQ